MFIECFILNGSMEHVDVYLHHNGRWIMDHVLSYDVGDVCIVKDFDIDFLSIISVKDILQITIGL